MIEDARSVRIEARWPLKLLLWGYVAPDTATACIIYLSMYWSMILSLVLNWVILVFMQDLIPSGFLYTSILSVLASVAFAIRKTFQQQYPFVRIAKFKVFLNFFFTPFALFWIYLLHYILPDLSRGYIFCMSLYGIFFPAMIVPFIASSVALLFSDIIRIFKGKKYE